MVSVQASRLPHNGCLRCHHCGKALGVADTRTSMSSGTIFQEGVESVLHEDYMDFFFKRCTLCGDTFSNTASQS